MRNSVKQLDAQIFMAIKVSYEDSKNLKDYLKALGLQYKWSKEYRNWQVWGPNINISKKQIKYLRETYKVVKLRRFF